MRPSRARPEAVKASSDSNKPREGVLDADVANLGGKVPLLLDPKFQTRAVVGSTTCYAPHREYVWGLDYVDELVYFYENAWGGQSAILNDANYNVVGAVELAYGAHIHYQYYPYGRYLRLFDQGYETEPRVSDNPEALYTEYVHGWSGDPPNPPFRLNIGFGGHILDPEMNAWYMRARIMPIRLGRMNAKDPNGTALILTTALGQFGQGPLVNAHVTPMAQYADGLSPYQYVRSNPNTGQDPTGLFTLVDMTATTALQGELIAMQGDLAASTVDAMKGVILWGTDRNATIDQLLGRASDGWDAHRSSVDSIFNAVNFYQNVQAASFGLAAVSGAFKVAQLGKKLWQKYASRAGGRPGLIGVINRGTNAFRKFFGFRPSVRHVAGKTVLGKYPRYLELAEQIGANVFNIPADVWDGMSDSARWAANQRFLDDAIARGDEIILSNPVKSIESATGYFKRELEYLVSRGFRLSEDGAKMLR